MAGERLAQPGLAGGDDVAVADEADVEAGAAGVADDHVGLGELGAGVGAPGDRRERRARANRVDRSLREVGDRHHAAERVGGEELAGEAERR